MLLKLFFNHVKRFGLEFKRFFLTLSFIHNFFRINIFPLAYFYQTNVKTFNCWSALQSSINPCTEEFRYNETKMLEMVVFKLL